MNSGMEAIFCFHSSDEEDPWCLCFEEPEDDDVCFFLSRPDALLRALLLEDPWTRSLDSSLLEDCCPELSLEPWLFSEVPDEELVLVFC
jgi:hypothetical protein